MAVIVVVVVVAEVLVALVARFGRLLKAGGAAASRFSSGVARARAPVRTSSDHLLPIVPRACFATSPKSFFESGEDAHTQHVVLHLSTWKTRDGRERVNWNDAEEGGARRP